jgi:GNAT superfamily N-acetyltransferase
MQLHDARAEDIAALAALWHEGWHVGHADVVPAALVERRTLAEFTGRLEEHRARVRVAWQGDVMAGFFMLKGDELEQFYVAGAMRGQGVAADLMAKAEAALGKGPKWLACSVGNERAARFYEKCGWLRLSTQAYGVETHKGPLVLDIWRYVKTL